MPIVNGRLRQCHDGALAITLGADHLTVSYNVFNSIGTLVPARGEMLATATRACRSPLGHRHPNRDRAREP